MACAVLAVARSSHAFIHHLQWFMCWFLYSTVKITHTHTRSHTHTRLVADCMAIKTFDFTTHKHTWPVAKGYANKHHELFKSKFAHAHTYIQTYTHANTHTCIPPLYPFILGLNKSNFVDISPHSLVHNCHLHNQATE